MSDNAKIILTGIAFAFIMLGFAGLSIITLDIPEYGLPIKLVTIAGSIFLFILAFGIMLIAREE